MMNDDKTVKDVPYIAYESEIVRAERTVKRLWITIVSLVGAIVINNVAWLIVMR